MIKVNVIIKDKKWLKFLKNPNNYLKNKIKKIQNNKFFIKNKIYHFSLLLSNSKEIQSLNKKFRKKNKSTDVLSFPFYDVKDLKKEIRRSREIYLGDIIINHKKLKKHDHLKKFKDRFNELWIHAFLHLFGYKHKKDKDFKKMNVLEKRFNKKIS